jgi:prepilin-type N-terminal cleavage/methylation domain-containing protein
MKPISARSQQGFSLIELLIAMTLTLIVAGIAATLLAKSFRMRSREDIRSDAIADAQRALNIVSREVANSGFGLLDNGLVAGDCNTGTIRVRANLNAYTLEPGNREVSNPDEDVKYLMYIDEAQNRHYLVRLDAVVAQTDRTKATTVLANRLDTFSLQYFDAAGTELNLGADPASIANTWMVRLRIGVTLPEDGRKGDLGYQPPSSVELVSDVVLRNSSQTTF